MLPVSTAKMIYEVGTRVGRKVHATKLLNDIGQNRDGSGTTCKPKSV